MMIQRLRLSWLAVLAAGAFLGWAAASGYLYPSHPDTLLAQNSKPRRTASAEVTQWPKPDPAFRGRIGPTFKDSKQDFPQPVKAPEGAPNVVVILLDDVGFGTITELSTGFPGYSGVWPREAEVQNAFATLDQWIHARSD